MGAKVLVAEVTSAASSAIRAYAHCTPGGQGNLTVLLINLSLNATTVKLGSLPATPRSEYVLTPSTDPASSLTRDTGLLGTGVNLNGQLLKLSADGSLPQIAPRLVASGAAVGVPATGIAFVVLPASPACSA